MDTQDIETLELFHKRMDKLRTNTRIFGGFKMQELFLAGDVSKGYCDFVLFDSNKK